MNRTAEGPTRKVVVSTNVALDGVMEAPDRLFFGFWSDEGAKSAHEELLQSDVLLSGRVTCEAFPEFWPTATNEPSIAERMNGLPKHVTSTTLEEPLEWSNSTLIKGDVAEEVDGLEGARHPGDYGPAHHRGGTLDAVRRVLRRHPRQRRQYRGPEPPVPAVGVRREASGAALEGRVYFRISASSAMATPAQNYDPEGLEREGVYYNEYGEDAPRSAGSASGMGLVGFAFRPHLNAADYFPMENLRRRERAAEFD